MSLSRILLHPLQLWEEHQSTVSLLLGPQTHLCLDSADHACDILELKSGRHKSSKSSLCPAIRESSEELNHHPGAQHI